jgi:MSHA biogenesis protein MshL
MLIGLFSLDACSNLSREQQQTDAALQPDIQRAKAFRPTRDVVHDVTGKKQPLLAHEVDVPDPAKTFSMTVDHAELFALAHTIAQSRGYAVATMTDVDPHALVSIEFSGLTFEQALQQIGLAAGYVAVVNDDTRTVTFATSGTYTFRVPTALLEKLSSDSSVGGDPSNSGAGGSSGSSGGMGGGPSMGGGGGGMGGQSSSQGSSLTASFVITSHTETPQASIRAYLARVGGENVAVEINPATGFIFARGNAIALKRIHDFLKVFTHDEMRQVQLQASIVSVTLGNTFQYGINWTKILSAGTGSVAVNTLGAVTSPATLSATLTNKSISSVVDALQQYTDVRVLTQPSVVAVNHTPATLFDGRKIPYLPQQTNTLTGGSTTYSQTTETVVYALDGVNISATVDILNNKLVQIRLVPVTNTVGTFDSFASGAVTAPEQTNSQSNMTVLVPNGQTVIMGGDRYSTANDSNSGVPGLINVPFLGKIFGGINKAHSSRENVLMLQAQIMPAPEYEPLVSEAL